MKTSSRIAAVLCLLALLPSCNLLRPPENARERPEGFQVGAYIGPVEVGSGMVLKRLRALRDREVVEGEAPVTTNLDAIK